MPGIIEAQGAGYPSAAPAAATPPASVAPAPFAFAGSGGVTPPGGNQGPARSVLQDWAPDPRKLESRLTFALLVKF